MHFNWDGPSRLTAQCSFKLWDSQTEGLKNHKYIFYLFWIILSPSDQMLGFFPKPLGHQPLTAAASIATIRALGEHSPLLRPIVGFFVIQTYIIQTQRSEWYKTRGATSNMNLHVHIMTAAFLFQPSLCNRYIRIFTIKAEKWHDGIEHCERNQDLFQNLTD